MKNSILSAILIATMICLFGFQTHAQDPPPPPGGGHGQGGGQVPGGGAPLGEGLFFLVALATVYGVRKKMLGGKSTDTNE